MDESEILGSSAAPLAIGGDKIGGNSNHSAPASNKSGTGQGGSSNSNSATASSGSHGGKVVPSS